MPVLQATFFQLDRSEIITDLVQRKPDLVPGSGFRLRTNLPIFVARTEKDVFGRIIFVRLQDFSELLGFEPRPRRRQKQFRQVSGDRL